MGSRELAEEAATLSWTFFSFSSSLQQINETWFSLAKGEQKYFFFLLFALSEVGL